jgi:hypothetical protein
MVHQPDEKNREKGDTDLGGDYARDDNRTGLGGDYARENPAPGTGGRGDQYGSDKPLLEDDEPPAR